MSVEPVEGVQEIAVCHVYVADGSGGSGGGGAAIARCLPHSPTFTASLSGSARPRTALTRPVPLFVLPRPDDPTNRARECV
ncbi:hypothetical protein E2C01_078266 [Portunus trituberculatus]|uniref:Uncharacterized protein n=1 Tax=Portunus trituberculatus TaxID=210409 RepID=A0A5B7ITP3_PORTR|nr:hypothetical protein [Portunus trituberculatus]